MRSKSALGAFPVGPSPKTYPPSDMQFLLIGAAAGVLSGLFGIGGGVLIVPCLLFFASMEPQMATGTSLVALLLPVGALGAWHYYQNGLLNVHAALWIALGLFLGAWAGAQVAVDISGALLQRAFAVFLFGMSVYVWIAAK